MNTIIAYARKHFTEMRRNYLSTFAGLFLIALCLPLALREMLGMTSEVGGEVMMCLGWASVLILTSNAFREWYTPGYDAFCLTLPISTTRRVIFLGVTSLVISILSAQLFFWATYYGWQLFAGFNCLDLQDDPMDIVLRLSLMQVVIHSLLMVCYSRGGRSRSWWLILGGLAAFYFLLNIPEMTHWVSDLHTSFPNLDNQLRLSGENWSIVLHNSPLGAATEVVEVVSCASIVVAFYLSAWCGFKEREARK